MDVDRSIFLSNILNWNQARVVPESKNGKLIGIRLFGIRSDSLLAALGLENGDCLESIDGLPIGSPENALEAYAAMRTATRVEIVVNRKETPVTLRYNIK